MIKLNTKHIYFWAFLFLIAFYTALAPGNRIETDDGFWFASNIRTVPLVEQLNPRYLLYMPVNSLIYRALTSIGVPISSYALMSLLSAISAALTILLLARLLHCSFGVSPKGSTISALLLAVTYGFWRYAFEAEAYSTAMLLIICGFLLVDWSGKDHRQQRTWRTAVAGALSGAAVLFYQANFIPLFLALPVLYLRRRHLHLLIVYLAVGGVMILGGYALAYLAIKPPELSFLNFMLSEVPREVNASPLTALFAFGSNIFSANWLFGFDIVIRFIESSFQNQVLVEEVYAAKNAGFLRFVPLITLPALLITLLWLISVLRRRAFPRPSRETLVVLIWLAIYTAVLYKGSPTAPEAWIMLLLPLAILAGRYIVEPCLRLGHARLLVAFTVLLMLHNLFGGIGIIYSRQGDYYAVKSQWLVENATAADTLLTGSANPFRRYLEYFLPAHVVNVFFQPEEMTSAVEQSRRDGVRLFALDDLFNPPPAMLSQYNKAYAENKDLINTLEANAIKVFESSTGDTFQIMPQTSKHKDGRQGI